ncbi:MAG: RNA degradosome polyphosphate kinase [Bacillota bacterium]
MDKYINRELSWLEFNTRVLEEAEDESHPLLERLKFLSIASSNLDEFFMVRVAGLYDQIAAGFNQPDKSGLTPIQQVEKISTVVHKMFERQYKCFTEELMPALFDNNINLLTIDMLNQQQIDFIERYYRNNIYPVLTPMIVDNSRQFPLILNKSLNIALILVNPKNSKNTIFATIQVPSVLGRFIEIPGNSGKIDLILLEDIIKNYISSVFKGHNIKAIGCYRITRNADLSVDEEGAEDLLEAIEESLKKRKWGSVDRLEVPDDINPSLLRALCKKTDVYDEGIYQVSGPIDLSFLMEIYSYLEFSELKYRNIKPQYSTYLKNKDIFKAISENDVLLHHPYQSFDHIINLVKKAAEDPDVLAIKQTLYRVSGDSPIVKVLTKAAENGKQITVLVELKARFDEENNIQWAKRLERAGCHVIYGLVGLKTHSKVLLIVRKEADGIKRYVHLGTGNYNDVTAKIYTDLGLLTSNPYIGTDISSLFNMITGYSNITNLHKVEIAPLSLREKFLHLIKRETEHARRGNDAAIIAKMNALVDKGIIEALYEASQAGVEIDLIVRGICCLRPGVEGLSENVRVISIIGRFLEHSRIFRFYNNGEEDIFLSSADWMPRNLDRRVELLFPIEHLGIKKRIRKILNAYLKDNIKARMLMPDGSYKPVENNCESFSSQDYFYNNYNKHIEQETTEEDKVEFIPIIK